ncbi:MAG: M48 family metalloprotease [Syntrophales bacterium]
MHAKINKTFRKASLLLFLPVFIFLYTPLAMASFTLDDEKKLGKEFYDKLEKDDLILHDDKANAYLNKLGELLLSKSDKLPFDYRFSIIRSSGINAFATPGGYIYVNQGLINLSENEGELAGVLAHEIAHVNGRHIAEMIDRSKKINISTLAAIIAGAFLGRGGELTAAVTSFSVAASTALSLQYSREHEEAADRAGLFYLDASGYNGKYMLDFLRVMRRYEYYSSTVPSYFFTHPGTEERIGYIDALLQTTYKKGGVEQIVGGLKRIQTILRLQEKDSSANLKFFSEEMAADRNNLDALYGLAVTEEKIGMASEAAAHFQRALALDGKDPDILRDFGISLFKLGKFTEAALYLRRAVGASPDDATANLFLGKTLLATSKIDETVDLLKKLEKNRPDDPDVCYDLAVAYGKANRKGQSHYYFGRYFKMKEKKESALFHFQAALKDLPANDKKAEEIRKEIDSLKNPARSKQPPVSPKSSGNAFFPR